MTLQRLGRRRAAKIFSKDLAFRSLEQVQGSANLIFRLQQAMKQTDPKYDSVGSIRHEDHRDRSDESRSDGRSDGWLSEAFRDNELALLGYAKHLLGDRDRANDLVQDVFLRLCKQPRGKVDGRVRQWLFRVCRNRALDIMKKEGRMKSLQDTVAEKEPSRDVDPITQADMAERYNDAMNLLGNLPERQQEVIRLKIEGGLSYREISHATGLSVGNVGYLLSTGLKTVRERLAPSESNS
ncbi:RNA polymerase sigma factor [Roseiconus lacunae]|nr:sigma-70 family RNA polymerase sigma factor [Roseiconus lacunae]